MVERFNGRISEVLKTTLFDSSLDLKALLERYLPIYNHPIPQKALDYRSPVQALQQWRDKRPDLFDKSEYNHPIPDSYIVEQVFGVLKLHYGMAKARYMGLKRNQARLGVMSIAYNLKRAANLQKECWALMG